MLRLKVCCVCSWEFQLARAWIIFIIRSCARAHTQTHKLTNETKPVAHKQQPNVSCVRTSSSSELFKPTFTANFFSANFCLWTEKESKERESLQLMRAHKQANGLKLLHIILLLLIFCFVRCSFIRSLVCWAELEHWTFELKSSSLSCCCCCNFSLARDSILQLSSNSHSHIFILCLSVSSLLFCWPFIAFSLVVVVVRAWIGCCCYKVRFIAKSSRALSGYLD